MIYDHLAVKKKKSGLPVFVFWDQKCLNFGMNWESGFLSGLKNAKVIVLLITNKVGPSFSNIHLLLIVLCQVLASIAANATSKQDNVLIEYLMIVDYTFRINLIQ